MRVAIFTDTYPPEINGVATSVRNLYRTLKEHGHEVLVVTTNFYGNELFEDGDILRMPGMELKLYGYDYRLASFYSKGGEAIIKDFRPDVVHIQHDGGIGQFGFLIAKKYNLPTIYTFHTAYEDYTYYVTKGYFDRLAKSIVRSYVRHKSLEADEFITPSNKIKEYMRFIGVDSYINVIPTGIDFGAFNKDKVDEDKVKAIKKEHGISDDTFVFLSIGRVAKEKSIDICLRGYASFIMKNPSFKSVFVIVGGGPQIDELKKLSRDLSIDKNVMFFGPIPPDEIPTYYQLGDLFVSASITETQGLTFMEAMSSEVMLLARYDDTLANTIHDGKNGFFFIDVDDMSEKIAKIVALPEEEKSQIRKNARESLSDYSMEMFYKRVMKVYERAIKRKW